MKNKKQTKYDEVAKKKDTEEKESNDLDVQTKVTFKNILGEEKYTEDLQKQFDEILDKLDNIKSTEELDTKIKNIEYTRDLIPLLSGSFSRRGAEFKTKVAQYKTNEQIETNTRKEILEIYNKELLTEIESELETFFSQNEIRDSEKRTDIINLLLSEINEKEKGKYTDFSINSLKKSGLLESDYTDLKDSIKKDSGATYKRNQINEQLDTIYTDLKTHITTSVSNKAFEGDDKMKEARDKFLENFEKVKDGGKAKFKLEKLYPKFKVDVEVEKTKKFVSKIVKSTIFLWPAAKKIGEYFGKRKQESYDKKNAEHMQKVKNGEVVGKYGVSLKGMTKEFNRIEDEARNLPTTYSKKVEELNNELKNENLKGAGRKIKTTELKEAQEEHDKLINGIVKQISDKKNEIKGNLRLDTEIVQTRKSGSYDAVRHGHTQGIPKNVNGIEKQYDGYTLKPYLKKGGLSYNLKRLKDTNDERLQKNSDIDIDKEYLAQKKKQITKLRKQVVEIANDVEESQKNLRPSGNSQGPGINDKGRSIT